MIVNNLDLHITVGEAVEIGKVMVKDGYCDVSTLLSNLCQIKHNQS